MSTRFYFTTTITPAVQPAVNSLWKNTPNFNQQTASGILTPNPVGGGSGASGSDKKNATGTSGAYDVILGQFVSDPLPAGRLQGTFSAAIMLGQSLDLTPSASNAFLQMVIRVVSNDGSVVRGVAYAGQTATSGSTVITAPNYKLPTPSTTGYSDSVRYLDGVALNGVNISEGDRIVVETGFRTNNTGTTDLVYLLAHSAIEDASSDLYEVATDVIDVVSASSIAMPLRAWIEFSSDIYPRPSVPEQYMFCEAGIILNSDAVMPFVDIESVDGLGNAPVRLTSNDRDGAFGSFVTSQYESARTVTLTGTVYANATDLEEYLDKLKANFAPTLRNRPLYFYADTGELRVVYGRSQGMMYTKDNTRSLGVTSIQVQIVCDDPRIYSAAVQKAIPGSVVFVGGNRETTAKIVAIGPGGTGGTSAVLLRNRLGVVRFTYNSSTFAAADIVVIDLDTHTIVKNYSQNYRSSVTVEQVSGPVNSWSTVCDGPNYLVGNGGTSTTFIEYRNAWR